MRIVMLVTTTYTDDSRVRRAAERLAAEGYDVHIVCTYPIDGARGQELALGPVTVHRVALRARDVPTAIAGRLRATMRWNESASSRLTASTGAPMGSSTTTLMRAMASPLLLVYRAALSRKMLATARSIRPDYVHAHDPDTLSAAGALAHQRLPLIYDAHELTTGRSDIFRWERWLDARRERRWVPKAHCVITVSPGIADILAQRHGVRPTVVRNVPLAPRAGAPPFDLREVAAITEGTRIVIHQGQRSPHRGLESLIRALQHLQDTHLVLLGSAVRGLDSDLRRIASSTGVAGRVHFLPPVPSEQLLSVTAQADLGVTLLEDVSLNHRLALPNKLFEYLQAGIPVVASDLPEIRQVLEACAGGTLCDPSDPRSIADAIVRTRSRPDSKRVPNAAGELQRLVDCYLNLPDCRQPK